MRALRTVLVLVTLAGALPACSTSDSPKALAAELAKAKTSDEEARVFGRIHRQRKGLSLVAFEREGRRLEMSDPGWFGKAHRLQIVLDDEKIDHVVIDPKNIETLMGE